MTICKHSECKKKASYNVIGLKARWCKAHKTSDMMDVVHKKCPCGRRSNFNFPGEKLGVYCNMCKTSDMVDVNHKKCPCRKNPSYNIPGESVAICCKDCKTPEMVNILHKRCACGKHPSFNVPGETIGVSCKDCKTPEMVDVVNKKCPCGTVPVFNLPGEPMGICCKECKNPDMVNVVGKKCSGYNGVECPAVYGYRLVPGCQYCLSCDPNDSRRDKFKKYENAFFRHVKGKINVKRREFFVRYDPDETTKKFARLDGIVFGDGIIVCLEVDENGHESYECDESRTHMVTAELLKEYPHTDVCWVRVNPTTKHKNPWGVAAKRVRAERFDAVIKAVDDILKDKTTDVIRVGFE